MKPETLLKHCQAIINKTPAEFGPTLVLTLSRPYTGNRVRLYGAVGPVGNVIDQIDGGLLVQFDIHSVVVWLKFWIECKGNS